MQLQQEHAQMIAWMAQQSGKDEAQMLAEILDEYFEDMRSPNAATRAALMQSRSGEGLQAFESTDTLFSEVKREIAQGIDS